MHKIKIQKWRQIKVCTKLIYEIKGTQLIQQSGKRYRLVLLILYQYVLNCREIYKFLDKYNLSKLAQKHTKTITIKDIEQIIFKCSTKKALIPDHFVGKFYQIFKEQ